MTEHTTGDRAHLVHLIRDQRVAMLTTTDHEGDLRGRPLSVQRIDDDGAVWFLVTQDAPWLGQVVDRPVGLAFSHGSTWVFASGRAALHDDQATVAALGDPVSNTWFDHSERRPVALHVDLAHADYWEGPGRMTQLFHLAKAAVTHRPPDMGERGEVRV